MTPAQIAHEVESALGRLPAESAGSAPLLRRALDAIADGLPADDVSVILTEALGRLSPGGPQPQA